MIYDSSVSLQCVISGIGLVTPLGITTRQTWDALLAGRSIDDHTKVPLESAQKLPRVSLLSIRAAQEAAGATALNDAALVVGTSKGPVESWLSPHAAHIATVARSSRPCKTMLPAGSLDPHNLHRLNVVRTGGTPVPPASIAHDPISAPSRLSDVAGTVRLGLGTVASDVARELGIGGPRLTVSAACASGLHALIRGAMLIQSGQFRRVLVVASEASVHPLFLASFARLGVLPPIGFGCRPFDWSRAGFVMSEAAAAVLLGAAEPGLGVAVERFAIGADATHLTGIDAEARSLRHVLRSTLDGSPVDLVHAHGTGTLLNDHIELAAIEDSIAASERPVLYSHKGALGHSLGAAGLVSVVLNVVAHRTGCIPPNVRTNNPIQTRSLTIPTQCVRESVGRSLAIAAGFGGAIAAVALRNTEL